MHAGASRRSVARSNAVAATGPPVANRFDVARADAIAHTALLQPADLPGGTWSVTSRDDFSQGAYPAIPECAATRVADAAHDPFLFTEYAGRAHICLSLEPATLPVDANELVLIYSNGTKAQTALSTFGSLYTASDFERCMEAAAAEDGVAFRVTKASPRIAVPSGGHAFAWDVTATAQGITFTMHLESIAWQSGNAFVELDMDGPPNGVTAELVSAAIAKAQARLVAAETP